MYVTAFGSCPCGVGFDKSSKNRSIGPKGHIILTGKNLYILMEEYIPMQSIRQIVYLLVSSIFALIASGVPVIGGNKDFVGMDMTGAYSSHGNVDSNTHHQSDFNLTVFFEMSLTSMFDDMVASDLSITGSLFLRILVFRFFLPLIHKECYRRS